MISVILLEQMRRKSRVTKFQSTAIWRKWILGKLLDLREIMINQSARPKLQLNPLRNCNLLWHDASRIEESCVLRNRCTGYEVSLIELKEGASLMSSKLCRAGIRKRVVAQPACKRIETCTRAVSLHGIDRLYKLVHSGNLGGWRIDVSDKQKQRKRRASLLDEYLYKNRNLLISIIPDLFIY